MNQKWNLILAFVQKYLEKFFQDLFYGIWEFGGPQ